jgi:putative FmdB family regulatory protein
MVERAGNGCALSRLAAAVQPNSEELPMPTYEYVCTECQHEFEAFQSMKDEPLKTCPACHRPSIKRKIGGGAGLIFKGSGFYITDYKKPAANASGESKSADSGGSAKPESKPAKTETKSAAPAKT